MRLGERVMGVTGAYTPEPRTLSFEHKDVQMSSSVHLYHIGFICYYLHHVQILFDNGVVQSCSTDTSLVNTAGQKLNDVSGITK